PAALKRSTQSAAISPHLFEPTAFVWATYEAWPYRKARAVEIARERVLPAADAQKLVDGERADHARWHEVFLALHAAEPYLDDLASPKAPWRPALAARGRPAA